MMSTTPTLFSGDVPPIPAVEFSSLPGFSRLFTDTVRGDEFLLSRFSGNASAVAVQPEMVQERLARSYDRDAIADVVRRTMSVQLHPLQEDNLAALLSEQTAVVVTGQQAGLFGGPLYTLLKAAGAVAAAQQVQEQHPDIRCVPVFWVEDNDHDFAEIAHTVVFDRELAVRRIALEEPAEDVRAPIGARRWNGIEAAVDALAAALQPTDFTEPLLEIVRRAYTTGERMSTSFVHLLNHILAPTGMLFVSAWLLQQRGLMAPVLRRELELPGSSKREVEQGIEQLRERGYHVQAEPAEINCMMLVDGKRHRIDRVGSDVRAGDAVYTHRELLALADSEPGRFSPTVLTRPIVQDTILPTVAYIAGPGEIGYAAELKELYKAFDNRMPAFLPRHSATLVERKFSLFLEEKHLAPETLFRPIEQVEKEFVAAIEDRELAAAFAEAEYRIREVFAGLEEKIEAVDPTLIPTTGKAMTTSLQQLEQLSARAVRAQKRQQEGAIGKLRQAHTALFPDHSLQERTTGWIFFVNKFGGDTVLAVLQELISAAPVRHYFPVVAFRRQS